MRTALSQERVAVTPRRSSASRYSFIGAVGALALTLIALTAPGAMAAGTPTPAWKLLAATGPTNLPPRQSEVQRVTVEAEGGTFALSTVSSEGVATPVVNAGVLNIVSGNRVAKIVSGTYEVGQRITGIGIPAETTVALIVSPTEIELSNAPTATNAARAVKIFTKEMTVGSGSFAVGDQLSGTGIAAGTVVTAVGAGTISVSKATTSAYTTGSIQLTATEVTAPIAFNASAAAVQAALQALPFFSAPSAVAVIGGPGGGTESPYFVLFGGPFANQDVRQLTASSSLLGAHAAVQIFTTVPGGFGSGEIGIFPTNMGGKATTSPVVVSLLLPAGIQTAGAANGEGWSCTTSSNEATCTMTAAVEALRGAKPVKVPVKVEPTAPTNTVAAVSISGGGAAPVGYQLPITVSNEQVPAGIQAFWAAAFDNQGQPYTQAGGHPYSAAADLVVTTVRSKIGNIVPAGDLRDVNVDLPPGFVGNPLITKRCPQSLVAQSGTNASPLCDPAEVAVGSLEPSVTKFGNPVVGTGAASPVFNDVPVFGSAAEFSATIAGPIQSITGGLRSGGVLPEDDFGVRIAALNVPTVNRIFKVLTVLFGEPGTAPGKAFLVNPTGCAQEREESAQGRGPATVIHASSWQQPNVFNSIADPVPVVTGCQALTEAWVGNGPDPQNEVPSFSFEPTTKQGSSPTGATARLHIPQTGLTNPNKLATSHLRNTVVTLPRGLSVNPSSANGLEACSEAQIGYLGSGFPLPNPIRFSEESPSCPDGSKLGSFEISTPLLEENIGGTIYLAAQEANPFHSLIALYLVVDNARFGIHLKLAGEVKPDPVTGQLTATFENNPQVPFEDLVLHFRGGANEPRSELATPEVCGHYATTGTLSPWSAELGEAAQINEAGFNPSGGCASSPGARPFSPSFEAGTTDPSAGGYSPMVIKVNRKDGEQELRSLNFTLPLGLTAKLAGIPYCPESAIASAAGKSGRAERSAPSCPAASQVATIDTSAGVGSEPIHVSGSLYLAGPYKGAPISFVSIVPAVAGPFDLGNVVVRAPAFVNLETAQVTVKSDPLPTILKGIPVKLRSIAINVNRPQFVLNPTNCNPMAFTTNIEGDSGATATPSNRFQVGGCNKLKFKPGLKFSLNGATRRSGHPAVKAVLTYPKKGAYSNIARAQVGLPHSEFLDQGNLDKVCTQPELKSATCPTRAIYGHAKAWTPLLEKPLEGPVYLGVGYGHKLPDLVADLNGQVRILLHSKVDTTKHEGIRNTFEVVPDAPVSRFVLEMKGGKKYGLLENSENICHKPQRLSAIFVAQNGLREHLTPLIANDCKKKKGKKSKSQGKGAKGKSKKIGQSHR